MRMLANRRTTAVAATNPRARRGSSLIEVMVSMTLLALLAVSHTAVTSRFSAGQKKVTLGAYRTATLSGLVNKYIVMPYDSLPFRTGCTTVTATATNPFASTGCVAVADMGSTRRRVQITLASAALSKTDTVIFNRAKNVVVGPLGP